MFFQEVCNGGQRHPDASVITDGMIGVQGDIEINAKEDCFLGNRNFVNILHGSKFSIAHGHNSFYFMLYSQAMNREKFRPRFRDEDLAAHFVLEMLVPAELAN